MGLVVSRTWQLEHSHSRPAAARARPAYVLRPTGRGAHLRPRLGPANSLSAARVHGRRAMAENRAVLSPRMAGSRPRPPHHAAPAASPTLPVHEELKIPSASSSFRAPIFFQSLRAIASAASPTGQPEHGYETLAA